MRLWLAVSALLLMALPAAADTFQGVGNRAVAYETFDEGVAGPSIVMLTGFTESYAFYGDLIDDFRGAGYSVYIMDHRGMGRSERLTANPQIVHVEQFSDYAADAEMFVTEVVPTAARPLFLFAHSTGALVGMQVLVRHPRLFDAVVFSAPLVKPNTSPFPTPVARLIAKLFDKLGFGMNYAFGFDDIDVEHLDFRSNRTTHDEGQFNARLDQFRSEPDLLQAGPSFRWVSEVIRASDEVMTLASKITAPLLMLQAGKDDYVDGPAQTALCSALPHCRLEAFPESFHEIFRERPDIRQKALAAALMHFERAGQN